MAHSISVFVLVLLGAEVSPHILRLPCKLEGQFFKNRQPIRVFSSNSTIMANKSYHVCIAECLKSKTCKTINHNLGNSSCELNTVNTTDFGAKVESTMSWVHYSTFWNRTKIGTNCITESTCKMNGTKVCRDVCSTRGYRCFCKDRFFGENCELYAANRRVAVGEPPRSCLHLKELEPDAMSDYYYVMWGSSYHKIYCDMTTDGGGWMMIGNLSYNPRVQRSISFISNFQNNVTFEDGIGLVTTDFFNEIYDLLGFQNLRIYCKKAASKTVHLKVTSLEVIKYLAMVKNDRPECLGTFVRLADDDANLSTGCKAGQWQANRWSRPGITYRLNNQLIYCIGCTGDGSFTFHPADSVFECDDKAGKADYKNVPGLWQYFVR